MAETPTFDLAGKRVFVAGHRGLVGSAVVRALRAAGYSNLLLRTRAELDLRDGPAVRAFFERERPEFVVVAAAVRPLLPPGTLVLPVGGMDAATMPAWRDAGAAGFGIGSAVYKPGDTAAAVAGKAGALLAALG